MSQSWEGSDQVSTRTLKAGVCFDTQEFVGRAAQAQHPLQAPPVLSPSSTKGIFDSSTKDRSGLSNRERWRSRNTLTLTRTSETRKQLSPHSSTRACRMRCWDKESSEGTRFRTNLNNCRQCRCCFNCGRSRIGPNRKPVHWCPARFTAGSRRFPLEQDDKVRPL